MSGRLGMGGGSCCLATKGEACFREGGGRPVGISYISMYFPLSLSSQRDSMVGQASLSLKGSGLLSGILQ